MRPDDLTGLGNLCRSEGRRRRIKDYIMDEKREPAIGRTGADDADLAD